MLPGSEPQSPTTERSGLGTGARIRTEICAFKERRPAIERHRQSSTVVDVHWRSRQDLNLRPSDSDSDALPLRHGNDWRE